MTAPATTLSPAELQRAAHNYLWLHFARMGAVVVEGLMPGLARSEHLVPHPVSWTPKAIRVALPGPTIDPDATAR